MDHCSLTVSGVLDSNVVPLVHHAGRSCHLRVIARVLIDGRQVRLFLCGAWAGLLAPQQPRGFGGVVGDDGGNSTRHGRDGRGNVIGGSVVQHPAQEGAE